MSELGEMIKARTLVFGIASDASAQEDSVINYCETRHQATTESAFWEGFPLRWGWPRLDETYTHKSWKPPPFLPRGKLGLKR